MTPGAGVASAAPPDAFGRALRDLRISVTDRCNFRCPYCMPEEIFGADFPFQPRDAILRFEEIERLARIFSALGATRQRLTGGEPLLRAQLPRLVARLAATPGIRDLALTTNGVLLPRFAGALKEAGLSRVTISLDSLDPETFAQMSGGRGTPEQVLAGIAAAEQAGLGPIKINCVVKRGVNEHEVVALARHFHGSKTILRFIEYMDVGTTNAWDRSQVVPAREIIERIGAELPIEALAPNYAGEVAQRYRYRDGGGEIGFITSVSQPFCGGCTRARLSADGRLFTCLFAAQGLDLLTPLRAGASDEDLRARIVGRWAARRDRYSEERAERTPLLTTRRRRVEMFQIGG